MGWCLIILLITMPMQIAISPQNAWNRRRAATTLTQPMIKSNRLLLTIYFIVLLHLFFENKVSYLTRLIVGLKNKRHYRLIDNGSYSQKQ